MSDNLNEMRKIAEAEETQKWGGWAFTEDDFDGFCIYINDGDNFGRSYVAKDMHQGVSEGESTARFIATFDPPIVLALLNRISEAEAERDFRQQENKELFDKLQAVRELADVWESGALRWEDPLKVPREVSLIRDALGIQTHDPDRGNSMSGEGPSCSCGYNGTPKECWKSRRLAGEQVPLHIDKAKDAREKSFNDILDGEPLA